MLEFLVTSKVRRRLLLLLWSGETGSTSELAARAGVGFAGAYRELQAMRRLELVTSERRGAATVFSSNRRHPLADALAALVAAPAPRASEPYEEQVKARVAALGAPVLSRRAAQKSAPLEDALVDAVALSHKDPALVRSLPVAFYRQKRRIDGDRLAHVARHRGEKAAVGLLLDLTAAISGDRRFAEWAKPLRDRRIRARRPFFHTRAAVLSFSTQRDEGPRVARRWGYRLDVPLDDFSTLFMKARRVH